jgi:hypothetical protein
MDVFYMHHQGFGIGALQQRPFRRPPAAYYASLRGAQFFVSMAHCCVVIYFFTLTRGLGAAVAA